MRFRLSGVALFFCLVPAIFAVKGDPAPLRNDRGEVAAIRALIAGASSEANQKELYFALPPSLRADVWTLHLEAFVQPESDLIAAQKSVVYEAIGLIAAGALDDDVQLPPEVENAFLARIRANFAPALATSIFASLGRTGRTRTGTPGEKGRIGVNVPECSCSTKSNWCDSVTNPEPYCKTLLRCMSTPDGCGTFWQYACDGTCSA
jgi:hypothetical protein